MEIIKSFIVTQLKLKNFEKIIKKFPYKATDTGGFSEMVLTVLVGVLALCVNDNIVSQLPNTQRAIS